MAVTPRIFYFLDRQAYAVMVYALVGLKFMGKRRFDPKTLVRTVTGNLFYKAECFYYTRKHRANLRKEGEYKAGN